MKLLLVIAITLLNRYPKMFDSEHKENCYSPSPQKESGLPSKTVGDPFALRSKRQQRRPDQSKFFQGYTWPHEGIR